jgi:hypothetical protein
VFVVTRAAREAGAAVALVLHTLEHDDGESLPEALLDELMSPLRGHVQLLEQPVPEPAGIDRG